MTKRIEWIDVAKGLGIFLVVLGHALPEGHWAGTIIWTFHMPLFFFLSGLTARPWTSGAFQPIFRGLKNLVIPYVFFSLIAIALYLSLNGKVTSAAAWTRFAGEMAYGVSGQDHKMPYDVPLWFFTCLLSIRILFILVTALFTSRRSTIIAAILLAAFAHAVVFVHFASLVWNLDVALVAMVFYTAAFVLNGKLLQRASGKPSVRGIRPAAWMFMSLVMVFTVAFLNGRVDMNGRGFGNIFYFYGGAFAGIYFVVALSRMMTGQAWLGGVGRAAIVIFPVHVLWTNLPYRTMPTIQWYGFRLTHSDLGGAIICAVLEILLCMPVYFLLKRWAPELIGQTRAKTKIRSQLYQTARSEATSASGE